MAGVTQFVRDDDGAFSCMRLLAVVVVMVVLVLWIAGNIAAGHYVPLGNAEAGIIGAAVGGKALQGYFEYGREP